MSRALTLLRLAAGGAPGRRRLLSPARDTYLPETGITATIDAAGRARVAWHQRARIYATRLP